ncbi:MAG: 1-deoxy-D-xylulose-5-phosphate reductoisomerase [Oscillospiraceae bacterium]|nr:1-deoxy-D-xylulose-5-phosphate reductoisomerase [Oscillospiraceae bacterium]MDD7040822.1 1-deoxy-D-xylulose-5-phosphate reductoisomerase [Oscillospiraceae bacterium]MDY2611304.1 1-deoxy-D-xylulose-5-phosphate reductoisomerase [Oscillospiraceae bacterium]
MEQKRITILGSTGSIGTQALQVVRRLGYRVEAISANTSIDLAEQQARAFSPRYAVMMDPQAAADLKIRLADTNTQVLCGMEGLCRIAALPENDLVLNSVVGMIGLRPTLAAIEAGNELALANKETLVAGGQLVMEAARRKKVRILPVDSEHSAIFQCLQGNPKKDALHKIILTASGGPFFGKKREELEQVTVKQALRHPNWVMGAKLTIDSSTLMNKGLEVIEASWLFQKSVDAIEVVIHRESVIHSMVEYADGSCIAQLGVPDMQIPIQYAMTYPNRVPSGVKPLSLADYGQLTFYRPDLETFSCLRVCMDALRMGGLYPCAANAANEEAVALFREEKIRFLQIGELVEKAAFAQRMPLEYTLEDVFWAEREARRFVREHGR